MRDNQSNVISLADWKAKQRAKQRRRYWYPVRDDDEPLRYRWELVEAEPIEDKIKT